jgi:hypothetical protein
VRRLPPARSSAVLPRQLLLQRRQGMPIECALCYSDVREERCLQASEPMTDPDLEGLRLPAIPKARAPAHDWSHPAVGQGDAALPGRWAEPPPPGRPDFTELLQAKRGLFADPLVRERLEALLARRIAGRDAEQGLSRGERDRLVRTRAKPRRQEFANALGLVLGNGFDLNAISRRPIPMDWARGLLGWRSHSPRDLSAGFIDDAATWLRDGDGRPAAVAVQPGFLDYEAAFLSGCVARVAYRRGIDILQLPEELGWLGRPANPRALVLWVPAS